MSVVHRAHDRAARPSRPLLPYVHLTMAMVIVGSSLPVGKVMVLDLPVHLALCLRFVLACALAWPLLLWREGWPRLSRRTWGVMAVQALCGSYLFNYFVLKGVCLTGAAAAGVAASTTPACMALTGWLLLRERPGRRSLWGVLLCAAGVALVTLRGGGANGAGSASDSLTMLAGMGLVLAGVAAESLFLLLRKTVREPLSALALSAILSVYGLVFVLPMGIPEAMALDWAAVPMRAWWAVGYYGAVFTVAAYLFWFAGVVRVRPATAGAFTGVMPISAVALSALLLGEPLTAWHLGGCALVLGGIWLSR